MYVKAKKILASELMYAKNLSEDDAFVWLEGVLDRPASRAGGKRPRRPRRPAAAAKATAEDASRGLACRASGPCSSPPGGESGSADDRPKAFARLGGLPLLAEPLRAARRERLRSTGSSSSRRRSGRSRRSCSPRSSARRRWPRACPAARRARLRSATGLAEVPDDGGDRARPRRGAAAAAARGRRRACSRRSARGSTAPCPACRSPTRSSASGRRRRRDARPRRARRGADAAGVRRVGAARGRRRRGLRLRLARRGRGRPGQGRCRATSGC